MSAPTNGLGTAAVSDALDRHGLAGQAEGIVPLSPGFRLRGPAFTVRYAPTGGRSGTVGDFIDDVPPGSVIVLDNGGRQDVTVWGDLLTTAAALRGLAGTVIHGVCRDAARILEVGLPVYSRGAFMRTGKDRVRAVAVQEIVSLGATSVEPGDLVVGDADGVVIVPREHEAAVLETARDVERVEAEIRAALEAGGRLTDARQVSGYHALQRDRRGAGGRIGR